ncbi:MAG: hypothetical protein ACJAVK_002854 [Akkermansiaceae bacterium]|jgi:hypothetical protein
MPLCTISKRNDALSVIKLRMAKLSIPAKPMLKPFLALSFFSLLTLLSSGEKKISFDRDIQPILSENCYYCHGTDPSHREGDLRLDLREDALDAGAIVPGKPEKSEMISRIHSHDPDDLMPPPDSNRKLTKAQKDLLARWIKEDAEYTNHWAFTPLPAPTGKSIDELVTAQLQEHDLKLKPKAKPHQLLRRLTFDLTGLPPTPEQVAKFNPNDPASFIDELLASPAYGEHMATPWLDVARYADSYGFQQDRHRDVWPYRDYVISSFNSNKPFDRFIHEQVAGDLLPDATRETKIATTFSRLHQQKVEGGSVPEEFRVEYVADRVHTFGTTFLGLTMECCRCHDHKYDPTTAKDYYSLFALFDDIDESGLYSYFNADAVPTPALSLPTGDQEKQLAAKQAAILAAQAKLGTTPLADNALETDVKLAPIPNQLLHLTFDDRNAKGPNKPVPGKVGHALHLTGDDAVGTKVGDFHREQPFTVSLWMQTPDVKDRAVVFSRSKAWHDAASRGYELLLIDNHLQWSLIHFWPGNAISIKTTEAIKPGKWVHVTVSNDGSSKAGGLKIHLNGKPAASKVVRDQLTRTIKGGGNPHITLGERMRDRGFKNGLVDEFRVFDRELSPAEIKHLHSPVEDQKCDLSANLLRGSSYQSALKEIQTARAAYNRLQESVTQIMVMEEMATPKQAYLLKRGAYDSRGKPVEPAFPAFLPGFDMPSKNRLDLAKWLTHPNHPLTSRVIVNRFWQALFGRGLVGTSEDFGIQGERPEHRALLDELSARYIASGWDTKALLKEIVTSKVYQQDSFADSLEFERDPENRMLARGPRHRLSAEQIRDQALAASGLLVSKIGGPSVHPYDLAESFKPSKPTYGEDLYRRSLYTYWKRTGPSPAMMAFGAVKRDVCSAKREITSTPLQAFVLLNGLQFVEATRHLAERATLKHPENLEETIKAMYLHLVSRQPDETELKILTQIYNEQLLHFQAHPNEAKTFLNQGHTKSKAPGPELAALATLAQALLNLHEVNIKQ